MPCRLLFGVDLSRLTTTSNIFAGNMIVDCHVDFIKKLIRKLIAMFTSRMYQLAIQQSTLGSELLLNVVDYLLVVDLVTNNRLSEIDCCLAVDYWFAIVIAVNLVCRLLVAMEIKVWHDKLGMALNMPISTKYL